MFSNPFEIAVYAALAALIPFFPQAIICTVKVAVIATLHMLLLIPGLDSATTFFLHVGRYLLAAAVKSLFPAILFVGVACVWLVDAGTGKLAGPQNLGSRVHRVLSLFNTCLNDPRGWFSVRRWHRGNRHERLFGVYPCMSPCFRGFEPAPGSGGLLCKRMSLDSPEFCTAAAVTRVAEGLRYRPLPKVAVSDEGCRAREASGLSEHQKLLVRTVCQQPDEFDNAFLRVPCFERYCARPGSEDEGPSTCAGLVPYRRRIPPAKQHVVALVLLLVVGAYYFFSMVTSFRAKQDKYAILSQSFLQEKMRV